VARKRTPRQDQALLDEVCAYPADDAPRLVYADWLEETGQPERGEFIRTQVELARMPADDPRKPDREDREWELLLAHGRDWFEALPAWAREGWPVFERGFPDGVSLTATQLLRRGEALTRLIPLQKLHLRAIGKAVPDVAACPLLGRLTSLDLARNPLGPDDLRALLASPHLGALKDLILSQCVLSDEGLQVLAGWPGLASVARLDLTWNYHLTPDGLAALLASPHLTGLRSLDLPQVNAERHVRALAGSSALGGLAHLSLGSYPVSAEGLRALGSSPSLGKLTSLDLTRAINPGGARALASLPLLGRLTSLDLSQAELGHDDLATLADSPHLGNLRELSFRENKIGPHMAHILASSPHLARLTTLDLRRNDLGPEGARALAESPHLANLRDLNLSGNALGNEGVRALAESPHFANLRTLLLHDNRLGQEAAEALASSPYLGSLRHLGIAHNGPMTLATLQNSPHLPRLLLVDVNFVLTPPWMGARRLPRQDGRPFFAR
jgi:uncharacterized protein (TIGR02996 family)